MIGLLMQIRGVPTTYIDRSDKRRNEVNKRNQIITRLVEIAFDTWTREELLELHLEMDSTPKDLFFEEMTDQLAKRFPEKFAVETIGIDLDSIESEMIARESPKSPKIIDLLEALKSSLKVGGK